MNACDECIYTYPDCPEGEYDKEDNEVLDLTQCSIGWCAYQTTKVDESCDKIDFVSDKKTIPVKLKVTKISKHQSDFSDLDDSWESVSK